MRGSGLGGVAELLVTGDGALDDDIDVQAAKADIAAREAATSGPAVRVRETDAMGWGSGEGMSVILSEAKDLGPRAEILRFAQDDIGTT